MTGSVPTSTHAELRVLRTRPPRTSTRLFVDTVASSTKSPRRLSLGAT
jgi:hypothetical protein